jgi:hypothetical protein
MLKTVFKKMRHEAHTIRKETGDYTVFIIIARRVP